VAEGPPLLEALRTLRLDADAAMRTAHRRSLPFGELVSDRWSRAQALGFGEGASIYDSAVVLGDVAVGPATWIGPHVILDGSGGLTIGATCSISAGVHIYSHDSVAWAVSGGTAAYRHAPVVIGDHCYIGPHAVITRGVTIGPRCIVGAHSVVTRDLPAGSIAVGATARVIGRVHVADDGAVTLEYFDATAPALQPAA
jgi:acetyltransferase-like isoleucine patch superfamily enzyme